MLRFACPTCGNNLTASSSKAGSIMSCPSCNQLVQVPQAPAGAAPKPHAASSSHHRSSRESGRTFWALCRLSLRGLCLAAVAIVLGSYALQSAGVTAADRADISLQALVWILGSYYLVRLIDDVAKSFEDVATRVRRRKR